MSSVHGHTVIHSPRPCVNAAADVVDCADPTEAHQPVGGAARPHAVVAQHVHRLTLIKVLFYARRPVGVCKRAGLSGATASQSSPRHAQQRAAHHSDMRLSGLSWKPAKLAVWCSHSSRTSMHCNTSPASRSLANASGCSSTTCGPSPGPPPPAAAVAERAARMQETGPRRRKRVERRDAAVSCILGRSVPVECRVRWSEAHGGRVLCGGSTSRVSA